MKADGFYKNGQPISKIENQVKTYYFKTGIIKAQGVCINDSMEGEWRFFRENGQLWQVGNFRENLKHGEWIRYNRQGIVEYQEFFEHGKQIRKR